MRLDLRNPSLQLALALLVGLGLGLVYSWLISPVQYVDADPSILRSDFKDQYRAVIAAAYSSTHDLARARARLTLLGDPDPVGALSAQAQRMLAAGEPFDRVRQLAQLATDIQQGGVSVPTLGTPVAGLPWTATPQSPPIANPSVDVQTTVQTEPTRTSVVLVTPTARPTFTPIPPPGPPFVLVGQDTVCDPDLKPGLLQVMLMDARRKQIPGVEIVITWDEGEGRFFTGFKPELGNGYADFVMQSGVDYSLRLVEGSSFVPELRAPNCTAPDGTPYLGGLLLTFQQP